MTHKQVWLGYLFVLIASLIFLYPYVGATYNSQLQAEKITDYVSQVNQVDSHPLIERAHHYNNTRGIIDIDGVNVTESDFTPEYANALTVPGSDVIARVTVPSVSVDLPIYRGTSAKSLDRGAGHLYGTDLPSGDIDRNVVITAHTGLATHKMFDNLHQLKLGEMFYVSVLDTTFAYKVVDLKTVSPYEAANFVHRVKGKDLTTLITCTPFAVNTHRLVVIGERVQLPPKITPPVPSKGIPESPTWIPYAVGGLISEFILALLIHLLISLTTPKYKPSHAK